MSRKFLGQITLVPLPAGSPANPGASLGVDTQGNVIALDSGFRGASIADITAANSAADFTAVSTTIPASGLFAGAAGEIRAAGTYTATSLGPSILFWVKVGSTKVISFSMAPGILGSSGSWNFRGTFVLRSTGTSAVLSLVGIIEVLNGTTVSQAQTITTATINSFTANTIAFGINWSSANASSSATCAQALIVPL